MAFIAPASDVTEEPQGFTAPQSDIEPTQSEPQGFTAPQSDIEIQQPEPTGFTAPKSDIETIEPEVVDEKERAALTRAQGGEPLPEAPKRAEEPSLARVGGGLVGEIVVGELGKSASAAAGAAIGGKIGAMGFAAGPVGVGTTAAGVAIGAVTGYVAGALGFGAVASVGAQKFEGRDEISTGRTVRDALINVIPGSKLAKGGSFLARTASAGARQGAIGAGIGAGGAQIETLIEEGRPATVKEMGVGAAFGAVLGGGLGVAGEGVRAAATRFSRMSPKQIETQLYKGLPDDAAVVNAIEEVAGETVTALHGKGFVNRINGYFKHNIILNKLAPNTRLGREASDVLFGQQARLKGAKATATTAENMLDMARTKLGDITLGTGPGARVLSKGTEEHSKLVNNVIASFIAGEAFTDPLTGATIKRIKDLPSWMEPIRKDLTDSRAMLREGTETLLKLHKEGKIVLPEALAAKIQENHNNESYLTTFYQFFNNPKYKPSVAAERKLVNTLVKHGSREDGKPMTEKQAKDFILGLQARRADTSADGLLRNMMTPFSGPRGQLKAKKQLSEAYAEYLGEVKDPVARIGMQLKNLERLNQQIEGDIRLGRVLTESNMAVTRDQIPVGRMGEYVPIELSGGTVHKTSRGGVDVYTSSRKNDALNPKLNKFSEEAQRLTEEAADSQLYVDRGLAAALTVRLTDGAGELATDLTERSLLRWLKQGIGLSKISKVVMNPPAWAIQFYGSWMSMFTNGSNPFRWKEAATGAKAALAGFETLGPKFLNTSKNFGLKDVQEFHRRGLLNQSVNARDALNVFRTGDENFVMKKVKGAARGYSFADDMHRVQQFLLNKEMVSKGLREMPAESAALLSDRVIGDIAESMTHLTYQNYDRGVPRALRTLSNYGAISQFAAFPIELMRNYYNKSVMAVQMRSGAFTSNVLDQRVRHLVREGMDPKDAQRLAEGARAGLDSTFKSHGNRMIASQAIAYGAVTAGIATFNQKMGVTPEKEKAYKENYIPSWDKDKPLAMWERDGKIHWMNMTYLTEVAQIANVPAEAARGTMDGGIGKGFYRSANAFLSPLWGKGPFVLEHLMPALENQIGGRDARISTSDNQFTSMMERSGWYINQTFLPGFIREYNRAIDASRDQPAIQTAMRQLGIRVNDTTREDGLRFAVRDLNTDFTTIKSEWRRSQRNLEGSALSNAYQDASKRHEDSFSNLIKLADNERILGSDQDAIIASLRKAGVSGMDALAAAKGVIPPLKFAPEDRSTDVWNGLSGMEASQRLSEIRKITDRSTREDMIRRHRRDLSDQRAGVSEADRVLRGQSVKKRAEYIYDEMQAHGNSEEILRNYMRKRVATDEVVRQVRLRQRRN